VHQERSPAALVTGFKGSRVQETPNRVRGFEGSWVPEHMIKLKSPVGQKCPDARPPKARGVKRTWMYVAATRGLPVNQLAGETPQMGVFHQPGIPKMVLLPLYRSVSYWVRTSTRFNLLMASCRGTAVIFPLRKLTIFPNCPPAIRSTAAIPK